MRVVYPDIPVRILARGIHNPNHIRIALRPRALEYDALAVVGNPRRPSLRNCTAGGQAIGVRTKVCSYSVRVNGKSRTITTVVYEHWYVAGYHIVRVDVGNSEIAHVLGARVVVHRDDVLGLSCWPGELVSRSEVAGVDPLVGGGVSERVMGRGV